MKIKPQRHQIFGFTLIELMVSIAIIGLLMTAGMVAFSTAQKNARDARRKADIQALGNAMEQYYLTAGLTYPTTSASLTSAYFAQGLPKDPKSKADYEYSLTTTAYCVCGTLEGSKGNALNAPSAGVCNWNNTVSATRFCASSQQ